MFLQELDVAAGGAQFSSLPRARGFSEGCGLSCLLLKPSPDETHHLHADLLLMKRPENSIWVSPPKIMLKMIQKLTRKISIIDILAVRAIFPVIYSWKMLSCGIS